MDFLLARARVLNEIIEHEAPEADKQSTLTPAVYNALAESELFWILVPKDLGGGGFTAVEALEVCEELSRSDPSTGWSTMANAIVTALAAGFLTDSSAKEFLAQDGGPVRGIGAGQLLPVGQATKVEGGYRLNGRFQFASGAGHASWIGAGFVVCDEKGELLLTDTGDPVARVAFLPRQEIEFLGNWDVIGLRGTGSYDYAFNDKFIPEKYTFDTFTTTPTRPEPIFRLGIINMAVLGHCAVVLGIMKRALEEIVAIASVKARPGYDSVIGDSQIFRRDFTRHEASYQAARGYIFKVFAEAENACAAGEHASPEQSARLRQATNWAHEVAVEVVGFAHRWAGQSAIRNPNPLSRCTRDLAAMTQHLLVDQMALVESAPALMEVYAKNTAE